MTIRNILTAALLGYFIALTSLAWADALPDYYPPSFRTWGVLEMVNIEGGAAVINDMAMTLSDNVHVYTLNSRFASVQSLQAGMKVGVVMSTSGNGNPLITDIWVLPDDYVDPRR